MPERAPSFSVIVVSRGRPAALARCLTGLGQLCGPAFEIVVVADPGGIEAVRPWAGQIKTVPFDAANISAARNAGIAVAAGEIVAFIDDDAVPEPSWLAHLARAFALPGVGLVGGWVRGRNGFSYQARSNWITSRGETVAFETGTEAHVVTPPDGTALKTEGTNCAVRRDVLARSGGFDPAFDFYHDETDLDLRLARAGVIAAVAPLAQVHHGQAASTTRAGDRAPTDLGQIGASTAVFLRKHAPEIDPEPVFDALRQTQRDRLIRYMVDGGLEPRDIARLMASLERGIAEGTARAVRPLPPIGPPLAPFTSFPQHPRPARVLAGRPWNRRALARAAKAALDAGEIVTILRLSPTFRPHHQGFTPQGWWLQTGGLFGRADRETLPPRSPKFAQRVAAETARIKTLRRCTFSGEA